MVPQVLAPEVVVGEAVAAAVADQLPASEESVALLHWS